MRIRIDDGFSDRTWNVMKAITVSRLALLRNMTGKGVSSARNHGIRHTRGT